MGYLNESGLARYDGLIKQWVTFKSGTVDGVDPLLNWQRTATAGAVTFSPLPAAPIDPTVNFLFTETGPASGTKSPDNPSTITGVTQAKVTRCGKNIVTPFPVGTKTTNGVTFVAGDDGTIVANGTATDAAFFSWGGEQTKLPAGTVLTLSGCPSGGSTDTYCLRWGDGTYDVGSGNTFTVGSGSQYFTIRIRPGTTVSNLVFRPQLELGSTATAFEPYDGADYTVNLGGTFYGGSVDLSTGVMTVTWWYNVFDGTENWYLADGSTESIPIFGLNNNTGVIFPYTMSASVSSSTRFCSHFPFNSSNIANTFSTWGTGNRLFIRTDGAVISTVGAFKNWVTQQHSNGTPLVFVYNLETPITAQLTPLQFYSPSQLDPYTPRLNTVYSDQVSVQVGYPKSPIATASELTNAIVSLGSNL